MKTLKQVQKENPHCTVMRFKDYVKNVKDGLLTPYDGYGYFHDGEKETNKQVLFGYGTLISMRTEYPYVCWYNK